MNEELIIGNVLVNWCLVHNAQYILLSVKKELFAYLECKNQNSSQINWKKPVSTPA